MKSDALFYELFQTAPQIFFELLQITPLCPYRFESLTVKTTEKRIDGILEPEQVGQTIYFIEVQASPDETIYWRTIREVSTYFEQRPDRKDDDWQAIVLWLNIAHDPGFGTLAGLANTPFPKLIAIDLPSLLHQLGQQTLAFNVLCPLIVDSETQVRQNLPTWVQNIRNTPNLRPDTEQRLLSVLIQFVEQKFTNLGYKELSTMLELTPLRETPSFQEEIFEITIELLLKQIKRKYRFADSTIDKLDARLHQLTLKDIEDLFEDIVDLTTLGEINAWLSARLPKSNAQ